MNDFDISSKASHLTDSISANGAHETSPLPTSLPDDDAKGIHPEAPPLEAHLDLLKKKIQDEKKIALEKGDDVLSENLEMLLANLESDQDIGIRAFELQELFELYSENGIEGAKSCLEFLESVLPTNITEHGPLEEVFSITGKIAILGAALTVAVNVGAGIGILYYKQKILDESRLALSEAKQKFEGLKTANKLTSDEVSRAEKALKEWTAAINAETEIINDEHAALIGKSISKTISALGELGAATLQGANAVAGATAISSTALAVFAYFEMKDKIEDNEIFSTWQTDFTTWQQNIIPRFTGNLSLSKEELEKLRTGSTQETEEAPTKASLLNPNSQITKNIYELDISGSASSDEIAALEKDFEKKEDVIKASLKPYFQNTVEQAPTLSNQRFLGLLVDAKAIPERKFYKGAEITRLRNDVAEGLIKINYDTWFARIDKSQLAKLYLHHQTLTHSGVNPTKDLLAKRQEVRKTLVEASMPKFDEKRDQIRAALISFYRETLEEAKQPDGDIQRYLMKLKLSTTPVDKEGIEAARLDINQRLKNLEESYNEWFDLLADSEEGRRALLELYVDKHQTIEETLKHSLREVVDHRLKIESQFVKLSLIDAKVSFGVATACAVISIGLLIAGLATLPLGGAGALLLLIGAAPATVAASFFCAELILSFRKKPKTTFALYKGLSFKLITNRLIKGIAVKRMRSKAQLVKARTEVVEKLMEGMNAVSRRGNQQEFDSIRSQLRQAAANLDQAKRALESADRRAQKWMAKVEVLEKKLGRLSWQDFAKNASLVVASRPEGMVDPINRLGQFDSLTAFKEALEKCDLDLISDETRYILETQLGFNMSELQSFLRGDNENKDSVGFALQKFTALKQDEVIRFIRRQRARMALNLIPSAQGAGTTTP